MDLLASRVGMSSLIRVVMFLSMMGLQSASVLPKVGSILLFKDLIV